MAPQDVGSRCNDTAQKKRRSPGPISESGGISDGGHGCSNAGGQQHSRRRTEVRDAPRETAAVLRRGFDEIRDGIDELATDRESLKEPHTNQQDWRPYAESTVSWQRPTATVETPIKRTDNANTKRRPTRSPKWPSTMAPSGRIANPAAKPPYTPRSEARRSCPGKNFDANRGASRP